MDYYFCHLSRLSVEQKIVKDKLIKYENRLSLRKPHQLYYFTLYVKVPINSTLLEFWKYSKEASVIDICVYRYYPKYFAISREIKFLFWPLKRSIQEILLPRNVSGSRGSQMGGTNDDFQQRRYQQVLLFTENDHFCLPCSKQW